MSKTAFVLLILITGSVLLVMACRKEKANQLIDCPRTYSYKNDIDTIIKTHCRFPGCHADASNSGFTMNNYEEFKIAVETKGVLAAIKHENDNPMPRIDPFQQTAYKLHDTLIQAIDCWVRQGMLDN